MTTGADNTASFAIDLDADDEPSESMADSLEKLKSKLQEGTEELRGMQAALRRLQGGSAVNIEAFRALRDRIDAQKASVAAAQERFIKLGGTFRDLSKDEAKTAAATEKLKNSLAKEASEAAKVAKERHEALFSALREGNAPVVGIADRVRSLGSMLGKGGVAGASLLAAAAVMALTVALAAGTAALARFGVAQADAARSELLQLEGLTKIRSWYGFAAGSATELQSAINSVSASSAIGRDQVAQYARQLYQAGLRGQNLSDALEATAIKASTQGEAYASAFVGMAAGANMAGYSVKKLSDDVKARLGGIAAKQMLSLDVQSQKLHEGISAIFRDLKIEGFLGAINEVTRLFTQNTESGKALKFIAESIFNPLIAGAEKALPFVKRFFQGMIIGGLEVQSDMLQLAIVVVAAAHKIRDALGLKGAFDDFDGLKLSLDAGVFAAKAFAFWLGSVATSAVVFGAMVAAVGGAFYYTFIKPVQLATEFLVGAFKKTFDFLTSIDTKSIGGKIVMGIIDGLTGGMGSLLAQVGDMGKLIVQRFKDTLGIHSPSAVMRAEAKMLPAGAVEGIEDGKPALNRSVESMIQIPSMAGIAAGNLGAGSAAGAKVDIHELHYHSSGKQNHQADAEDFADRLLRELERAGIHMGAP